MIEILDYQDTPATVAARWWWSEERGLTTDDALLPWLKEEGVAVPQADRTLRIVYPRDGRAFFDALKFRQGTFIGLHGPVVVAEQGGEPVQ